MNFLDVAGPPGAGKSTICDPIWHHKAIDWDGNLPPSSWRPFLDEMTTLFGLIRRHWSFVPAVRMNNRSVRKMATVARMMDVGRQYLPVTIRNERGEPLEYRKHAAYIQTGLVQRGLGFGWRLNQMGADVNLIRRYFWLMPVSIGVAFLEADDATIIARNNARKQVAATAHEDRAFMVPLMRGAIRIAKEVLHERGVPVLELDVQSQTPDEARGHLLAFADNPPCDASALGSGGETPLLSPPPWWG
jgi:hypothetical protein